MFSGLTNQVSSWMGSVKGEQEEKVPTPTEDNSDLVGTDKKDGSPTKATGGKLEMLSNVKNQIEGIGGWLGSSIPKLRKNETEGLTEEEPVAVEKTTSPGDIGAPKDDDDNSSATGGADSGPQSVAESPTEEKDSQFTNVQSKALAGAKSFGSFLYSAVNKAGKTVSEAGAKIKETVEKNAILTEFNKEQEAFMKNQNATSSAPLPPWVGCANEESIKEECLSLSTDQRNFIRSPPAGVEFDFDYEVSYPIAMAIMEQDPNLEKMRYELVPKIITEENFWKNYFYRVSLICQASELSSTSREDDSQSIAKTSDNLLEEDWEKELEAELQDYELIDAHKMVEKGENWEHDIEDLLHDDESDLK
ncbi:unnamed protein product [Callosobruchus maculatus]|uniref:BSD domain-containing protein n=1 Tax=Callosobruchus maculatus TaxID=64391 RepID=A0A653CKK2_CALMS|nr:unnamed protein product [Callosobruchus maculatus]